MIFEIQGGNKLYGSVTTRTSKNGALGVICATLLNQGQTTIKNVPRIEEVFRMIEVLESLDVKCSWRDSNLTIQPPTKLSFEKINRESAKKMRSLIMLIGALIHYRKEFSLPQSGGCKLGARTITPHLLALGNLGVKIEAKKDCYKISAPKLNSAEFVLYESGDTVTENALIAAALIPGQTRIRFASSNYMVQDVCFFLQKLGLKIEGLGTSNLVIYGQKKINKNIIYELGEDPIDSMFFIAAAAVTNSAIEIKRCPIDFLEVELLKLKMMGFNFTRSKIYRGLNGQINLIDIKTAPSNLHALSDKIEAHPYPGINIDNLPFFAVIATQAQGETLIHDWIYEKRAIHYKELDKIGAETTLADPHRFFVKGKTKLKPAEVICPPALRPAAIILIGMLAAKGRSTLRNVYSINRGYEDIVHRLNKLGAKIKIFQD